MHQGGSQEPPFSFLLLEIKRSNDRERVQRENFALGMFDALLGHGTDVDPEKLRQRLDGVLIENERVDIAYKIIRDFFVFTNFRVILVDVQGITGSKVDFMSIPYRAITRFSVETAGTFDLDAELKIWVSGSPDPIQKTLKKGSDVRGVQRAIATAIFR